MQFLKDKILFFSFWSIFYDSLSLKIVSILCLQLDFYHGCHGLCTSNPSSKKSESRNPIYGRPRWNSEKNYGNQKYCWGKNNFVITREIKENTFSKGKRNLSWYFQVIVVNSDGITVKSTLENSLSVQVRK